MTNINKQTLVEEINKMYSSITNNTLEKESLVQFLTDLRLILTSKNMGPPILTILKILPDSEILSRVKKYL